MKKDDIQDKKQVPENDLITPEPAENILPELQGDNQEQDIDDLVHNTVIEVIPEDEEIDADDAVHRPTADSSNEPDTEKDPDDLVHGN